MKTLKKSLCIVLSFLMIFGTVVFFNPTKADAIYVSEFTCSDYYYYPVGTQFISELKLVQGEYTFCGTSTKEDRKAFVDNLKTQLIDEGYIIVGTSDIGDGSTQMTANLTQRKDKATNWTVFTFLGYKTTTDINKAAVTSIRARHEADTSSPWTVDDINYNLLEAYEINRSIAGDSIYLYASDDPAAGLPITSIKISNTTENIDANDWIGQNNQLVLNGDGNISNLNNGSSVGNYIYMGYGDYGLFTKIPEATIKALYDQIVRYDTIGETNPGTDSLYNKALTIYNAFDNKYKASTYHKYEIEQATTELKAIIDASTDADTDDTHICSDQNQDGICDICGEVSAQNCDCLCHSINRFFKLIHDIWILICRLFGMNDYCCCDYNNSHW